MPRAQRLSTRLDSFLEAVFESPTDPFSLYWDIAAHISTEEIALVQRTIRRKLKQKGSVAPETAILVACLMGLGGFSPQRILHFLSLYVPGGIRQSLFELAVSAIFLGEPPVSSALLYDLTQYTYLEKRLLVRKSVEISDTLARTLDPRVLLFLYLLALRDDLSNEHVKLIALVLKRCLPSRELRGRIGRVSLEEYGELARAVRTAEERSLDLDLATLPSRATRAFDRDSASFFLDKYFSDEAIAEASASAPEVPKRPLPPRRPVREREPEGAAPPPRSRRPRTAPEPRPARGDVPRTAREPSAPSRARRGSDEVSPRHDADGVPRSPRGRRAGPALTRSSLIAVPTALSAILLAIVIAVVPAGLRSRAPAPPSAAPAPAASSAANAPASAGPDASVTSLNAPPTPAAAPQAPPAHAPAAPTVTYVVKPGDSLWKIFVSHSGDGDRSGWLDFVSRARSTNDLADPDRLRPGKVLSLPGPK